MTIKFEKLKPGMVLYDRHSERMGNTMLRSVAEWPVRVLEIDTATAMVSWNGNPPRRYCRRKLECLSTWSMNDPGVEVALGVFGQVIRVRRKAASK